MPEPVPPATIVDMRPSTMARMISSMRRSNEPLAIRASGVRASLRNFRMVMMLWSTATPLSDALTREPLNGVPGRTMVQSHSGEASSQRRFMPAAMRSMMNFTWSSSSKHTSVSQRRPSRSIQTASGALTMISERDSS